MTTAPYSGPTAGVLRKMARQLGLDVEITGRGPSPEARDAFWIAVNRAVVAAMRVGSWSRLARLYEAQAEILRGEGSEFQRLLTLSFAADLRAIGTGRILILANDCARCISDDGATAGVREELRAQRLPHLDCENGRCTCMYLRDQVIR